jgi:2-phospho-L-lactate/phosphoenolpyruvate guanylyltransferase
MGQDTVALRRAVLLPVKDPESAKQRLARILSGEERRELAWAMLADVARAVSTCQACRVVVVARSPEVWAWAKAQGWDILEEERQVSESSSVDQASVELGRQGIGAVLRLPGDIPLITTADIDSLLCRDLVPGSAVIVPSGERTGTNALLRCPPDGFPSCFGPDSYRLHCEAAARAGIKLHTVMNERISLDIDQPADLKAFLETRGGESTRSVLRSLRLENRLAHA